IVYTKMGLVMSTLWWLLGWNNAISPQTIVMVGLDGAGKTTILYSLKLGHLVQTTPSIGFNIETVQYRNISFFIWDVCGQKEYRALWRHYYNNVNAIIFVVDSSDRERMEEVREELMHVANEPALNGAPLLILCNKQDNLNAAGINEIVSLLNLESIVDRKWHCQSTIALSG
ncbi:hypothetical protein SAMD00019534_046740, partial [Acytostelium subglobosum LB1]|uniref:hypothetical protein n=1 Tax=Acytostelium subglobosum LB1 TaxID=1410327 RepID=UPI0006451B02